MDYAFDADQLATIAQAVDDACIKLACSDAQREVIAARVIGFAAKGARDYETLFAIATFQRDALDHFGAANAA